ncbi:BrnT family toxin [Cysteiniphilum litorale]|uniref:BrnT family toxin n=1 Tax=Cysteiniphilum litorale TaxID=2056700 RepID=UPI003F8852C6
MKFEWDEAKSLLNLEKHKVSFELAEYLFNDSMLVAVDNRVDYGETRYIAYSMYDGSLFNIVYTKRSGNIRIISMRKANEREKTKYQAAIKRY